MSDEIELAEKGELGGNVKCVQAGELSQATLTQFRPLPTSWMYRKWHLFYFFGPIMPFFASSETQLLLVALVCFSNPGMYNALGGLGGAGEASNHAYDVGQVACYSTFAFCTFITGSVCNVIGLRWTLTLGSVGYAVYLAAFLCFKHTENQGFVLFAGILLGASAAFLWTAQGVVLLCYPIEKSRGKAISIFWVIFNLGAVIGAVNPLSTNAEVTTPKTLNDWTYGVFIAVTTTGGLLAALSRNAGDVIRADGSWIEVRPQTHWRDEFWWLWDTLCTYTYILLLFPMFFASNFFYTYQFNGFNGSHFNIRTRSLNNLIYWCAQIIGSLAFGLTIDWIPLRRSVKAKWTWSLLLVLTMAIWAPGYLWQSSVLDRKDNSTPTLPIMDWTGPAYGKSIAMYIGYGVYDAIWQSAVYWFLGALTNSTPLAANFVGFYKGLQSAGAAISWRLDMVGRPYMTELLADWILLASALAFALPVIYWKILDKRPKLRHYPRPHRLIPRQGKKVASQTVDIDAIKAEISPELSILVPGITTPLPPPPTRSAPALPTAGDPTGPGATADPPSVDGSLGIDLSALQDHPCGGGLELRNKIDGRHNVDHRGSRPDSMLTFREALMDSTQEASQQETANIDRTARRSQLLDELYN